MELMSRAEIAEAIAALDLGAEGIDELLDNPGLAQEGVEEWLAWAKGQPSKVRVADGTVPWGILPQGLVGKPARQGFSNVTFFWLSCDINAFLNL